jgi:hypothetical protein
MIDVHGHEQYTVDPCDIYKVAIMAMRNTQWIHAKIDHSHEWIHKWSYVSKSKSEDIWSQWSEQVDPLQVPMSEGWYNMSGRSTKYVMLVLHPKSSK